jgi:hypothetical protein
MIRECTDADFNTIFGIINDAAQAYKGVVPDNRWHEPYMPIEGKQGCQTYTFDKTDTVFYIYSIMAVC